MNADLRHARTVRCLADELALAIAAAEADGLEVHVAFEQAEIDTTDMASPRDARIFQHTTVAKVRIVRPID